MPRTYTKVMVVRMHSQALGLCSWLLLALAVDATAQTLRPHPSNPRVWTIDGKAPVVLAGSHEGWELQDDAWDQMRTFDYEGYLDLLERHGHNVIRLWTVEHTRSAPGNPRAIATPMPFERTGPGVALDGAPKFDLERLDPEYFERLRARVQMAGERDIFVIVMLFQGVSVWSNDDNWFGHYLNGANNINEVDADANEDGHGWEAHSLEDSVRDLVLPVQERYVRRVVETLADQDHVLYEIANEDRRGTAEWQVYWLDFVRQLEAELGVSHPVGMTFRGRGGTNQELAMSGADWISPRYTSSLLDPDPADGDQIVVLDTDHFAPYSADAGFAWRAFLRGHHPIALDRLDDMTTRSPHHALREAMGLVVWLSEQIDLANMTPRGDLSSTGYCLANPGQEYLVYLLARRRARVELESGRYRVHWYSSESDLSLDAGVLEGGSRRVTAPFRGALLHLRRVADEMKVSSLER